MATMGWVYFGIPPPKLGHSLKTTWKVVRADQFSFYYVNEATREERNCFRNGLESILGCYKVTVGTRFQYRQHSDRWTWLEECHMILR